MSIILSCLKQALDIVSTLVLPLNILVEVRCVDHLVKVSLLLLLHVNEWLLHILFDLGLLLCHFCFIVVVWNGMLLVYAVVVYPLSRSIKQGDTPVKSFHDIEFLVCVIEYIGLRT